MAWFGYDQGVFSGVLISSDFKKWFPETQDADISGITSSSFSVRILPVYAHDDGVQCRL